MFKKLLSTIFFVVVMLAAVMFWGSSLNASQLPTKENPLIINEKNKQVLIYTEVHEMNVHQSNVHWGVVFKGGKFQDRAILKAYVHHLDFHDALIKIGAKPGNNLTKDTIVNMFKVTPLR